MQCQEAQLARMDTMGYRCAGMKNLLSRDTGNETQCLLKVPAWAYETYENLPILTLRRR